MSAKALAGQNEFLPSVFNDFFKPWNAWLDNGCLKLVLPKTEETKKITAKQIAVS